MTKHRPHHGKWRIESSLDMATGRRTWKTTPPRFAYRPHGKRSSATYDEALAHVWEAKGKRAMVFPSKTHPGMWFWKRDDKNLGWHPDHTTAVENALGIDA